MTLFVLSLNNEHFPCVAGDHSYMQFRTDLTGLISLPSNIADFTREWQKQQNEKNRQILIFWQIDEVVDDDDHNHGTNDNDGTNGNGFPSLFAISEVSISNNNEQSIDVCPPQKRTTNFMMLVAIPTAVKWATTKTTATIKAETANSTSAVRRGHGLSVPFAAIAWAR